MYGIAWALVGLLIVGVIIVDAVWTTLTVSGAGPLSSIAAGFVGRAAMRGHQIVAENASILALCTSFLLWSLPLWAGWTLIFCGSAEAVVDSATDVPASLVGRLYFTGFTLTTLGIGDLVPGKGVWRVATVFAALSGFALLTLCITYTLSVLSALNERRSLGAAVGHLGGSPEDVLLLLADGGGQALTTRLLTLTDQLESAAVKTDAYPVLDFSHVDDPRRSFARAVVILGEVALLLELAVDREQSLSSAVWKPLRSAVELLAHEKHPSADTAEFEPSSPDLTVLERGGLKLAADARQALARAEIKRLRAGWAAWLRWHGRSESGVKNEVHPD